VTSDKQDEEGGEHGSRKLISETSPDQPHGIRVVVDGGILEFDLADDVAGVDGHEAESDAHDDTGHHAEGGKGTGHTERTQGNGLDNEANGQSLPSEAIELVRALANGGGLFEVELGVALLAVGRAGGVDREGMVVHDGGWSHVE